MSVNTSCIRLLASAVKSPTPIEESEKWMIKAVKSRRDVHNIYTAGEVYDRPKWWPKQPVEFFTLYQFLADDTGAIAPPQTRVIYGVPFESYVNPVQRKADRPQSSGSGSFLIAIDVEDLPGAFDEFRKRLPEYFLIWPKVSGVLTFRRWVQTSRVGWTCGLLENHSAAIPLPAELRQRLPVDHEVDIFTPLQDTASLTD
jgi:hypothetical protein